MFACGRSFKKQKKTTIIKGGQREQCFFHSYTLEGAHSYKQELPNNRFVNVVITACSSTARGSPWVEQAGPRDGSSEGRRDTEEESNF